MLNSVVCGDCIGVMREMKEGSVGLIIFSPPYNVRMNYDTCQDEWDWSYYYSWMERVIQADDAVVFDPFCGAGTTLVAAQEMGRPFIGIDISPKYCEVARENLNEFQHKMSFNTQ